MRNHREYPVTRAEVQNTQSPRSLFDFADGLGSVLAHRHKNGGGWVAVSATVSETAYVGRNARVYGNALVSGNARVYGDARVYGNAWVYGV